MQDFVNILGNFGFPIAITVYLLFRFEKKLDKLEVTNDEKVRRIDALVVETDELKQEILELKDIIRRKRK